jgi:hypothetical protein
MGVTNLIVIDYDGEHKKYIVTKTVVMDVERTFP